MKVMGPCVGSDGDHLFEKNSVGLTRTKKILLRTTLQFGETGNKRVEDSGLHKSEEKGDTVGNYAHLATSAYDVCDGLAGRVL